MKKLTLKIWILLAPFCWATAQSEDSLLLDSAQLLEIISYYQEANRMDSLLAYERGKIELSDGLATIDLGTAFKYLNPDEANKIIAEAWGNPPQETLGMIIPDSINPYLPDGWGIIIYYSEDGHIEDDDAADIDYEEMLETMKEEAIEESEERREQGYSGYEVIGWAETPYYDDASKKLYWAKELAFDGSDVHTLNYDIRILGRKGFLQMNAVAGTDQLEIVKPSMQALLANVEFAEGNTYFDFDPEVDEVAAYGIGALVAGKLAAKAGLIKVIGLFFAKFWKFILIGFAAIGAFVKKLWTGKEKREL